MYNNFPGANADAAALYPATVTRVGGGGDGDVGIVAPTADSRLEDEAMIPQSNTFLMWLTGPRKIDRVLFLEYLHGGSDMATLMGCCCLDLKFSVATWLVAICAQEDLSTGQHK